MRLTFCGAAGEVTGSNYLLESNGVKIVIDCGLAQGSRFAEEENFQPFRYDPKEITAVLVTHAHIDHVGRIPQLFTLGFTGTVYSTPPTRDFAEILLLDSEHLLGNVAAELGHEPLYSVEDIQNAMSKWEGKKYHEPVDVGPFHIEFFDAGHILGSSFIRVSAEGKSVVFSGDLGNTPAPIIRATEKLPDTNYLLIESTYGGRIHEHRDQREEELEAAIGATVARGGVVVIPAFAMERTQDLLFHLDQLVQEKRIPRIPVYMDSPLAIKLTTIYQKYKSYFDEEASEKLKEGDQLFNFPDLHTCLTSEESKAINDVPAPKIIIAGSGMSNGGRILHHEQRYLPDPKNCILIVGYQARNTLGRMIQEGARHVEIFGESVAVRAEVRTIHAYSAHADQPRLIDWVSPHAATITKAFIIHGEKDQGASLQEKFKGMGLNSEIPSIGETVEL
jgi:metallo-beta-lactamase family protein